MSLAIIVAVIGAWVWLTRDRFVVYADGTAYTVAGQYETVQDVVSAAGITVRPQDAVAPAGLLPADPSVSIAVQRAQQVVVETDDGRRKHWTHQPNLGGFLAEISIQPQRSDQIYADGMRVVPAALDNQPLPEEVAIGRFTVVRVRDGNETQVIRTRGQTVGEALREAGIRIYAADSTEPALGSWLEPEMEIVIQRSIPLTIQADGRLIQTRSHHRRASAVLAEAGVGLVGFDYAQPDDEARLEAGDVIQVVRVTEQFQVVDESIPYESLLQPTAELEIDNRAVLQAGVPGIQRTRIRVRYENGVEVGREPDGTWVAREPQPEIVGYGTNVVVRTMDTPDGPVEYWRQVRMRVTAYMAQTSGKPKDHPGYGITASGRVAGYGVVAIDPRVVPFRSEVYVPGYGRAFAGDTGGGVKGRWIDLGYEDNWDTFEHWSGYVDVYYLTPVPDDINYLIPTTLP